MYNLLLQAVVIPIFASVLVYLSAGKLGKRVGWIAFASLLYTTLLLVYVGSQTFNGGQVQETYPWVASVGLSFGFLADGLSLPVAAVMNLVLLATTVYSMPYMEKRIRGIYDKDDRRAYGIYYLSFLLLSVGLVGIALSTNLIELYLFLELVLIPTFVIISFFGYSDKERVAITYFIWNHLGAFLFLGGIALVFAASGSFEISAMAGLSSSPYAAWIVGLILVGWLVKMAVFGVHMWLPLTEAEPPTALAATMAVVAGVGNYVLVRLLVLGMPTVFQWFSLPLMALAVFTMFYGGALTLAQTDVKYLFAWSTVSQNAYSVLGIASLTVLGVSGGVFYFLSHIMGKFILFSIAGILLTQTGLRDIRSMGGLASKMPLTATIALIGTLILSAVPPTSGFQAEWIMFAGIFFHGAVGSSSYLAVAFLGLIATVFTVAYTFWPFRRIFFGSLPSALEGVREAPLTMTLPLLAVAAISIVIGIYPDLITKFLIPYVNNLPLGGGR
ncbi:MAG: complex I subunit 5 family protein [Thaumarchaeota archaeon]|nr:complex I subunit 5 family protein [Nitrososphaerota archaeon]